MTEPEDICKLLHNKYETLYNSVPSDKEVLHQLERTLSHKIHVLDPKDFMFDSDSIFKEIKKLKQNKHDGTSGLWSNHLKLAPASISVALTQLLNSMIVHGYTPHQLLLGTIFSIVKDSHGDICSSDNLRGIALSSCIGKLFNAMLLEKYRKHLCTSDLQFSYKPGHSTTLCTLTLKEVVNYFLHHGTPVYSALVDASKAFDKVRIDKITQLLLQRDLPAPVIRLFVDNLTRQQMQVYWAGCDSSAFSCTNGLRQGGVASPVLFAVYFDELLLRLSKSGAGCYVKHLFMGALAYADDVTVLAPSLQALSTLLQVCDDFAAEYSVTFNSKKTICIAFGQPDSFSSTFIKLHGEILQWQSSVKHLGNIVTHTLEDNADIRMKSNDLVRRTNSVVVNFRAVPRETCNMMYNSNCHIYGSQMWDLTNTRAIETFHVQWRKGIRILWNLPRCARSNILHHLIGRPPLINQICHRFMRLYQSITRGNNEVVKVMANLSLSQPLGIIGRNVRFCHNLPAASDDGLRKAVMLKDLTKCLEGSMDNGLNTNELSALINFIST